MSVARSADRRRLGIVLGALVLTALTGCETTQQKSARIEVQDDRVLAAQQPVRVVRADSEISVLGVAIVRGSGHVAIAVRLRNDGARPLSDLPISVGVRTRSGRTTYLNGTANLPYFETHIGAVAPGTPTTWVFTGRGAAAPAGAPFALVGAPAFTVAGTPATLPDISAALDTARAGDDVSATITNHSGIPQYTLAVYASARAGGRVLAAGQAAVAQLDPGASATVAIPLVGDRGASSVQLDAPPTLLR